MVDTVFFFSRYLMSKMLIRIRVRNRKPKQTFADSFFFLAPSSAVFVLEENPNNYILRTVHEYGKNSYFILLVGFHSGFKITEKRFYRNDFSSFFDDTPVENH